MQDWFSHHWYISYLIIFVLVAYVYNKVFRAQHKLPLWKEAILYVLMAVGCVLLLIFQIFRLPIIQCLFVAVVLMLMVRIRYLVEGRQKKKQTQVPPAE
ncbi:YlaH-like family protein [Paenibacillus tuaregi]|uniref:YlaH-like family protein n=1 Tax=Paenibacillus tuaregi TaxID=1816681 RepID=UPI000837C417|nr:YlaH-like family protein [Paenibacillus tuaregi]